MLSGELEVEGDLNVSGDIQSPTIAQLQEIIAQLQVQIESLQEQILNSQSDVSQKIVDVTVNNLHTLNLEDLLPGANIDWAIINIIGCYSEFCAIEKHAQDPYEKSTHLITDEVGYHYSKNYTSCLYIEKEYDIKFLFEENGPNTIKLLITAPFNTETRRQK